MSVYNRKLFFNRGGQVNARGTGITSGLVQPVQKFQEGGNVIDPMAKAKAAFNAGLMSGRSRNAGPIGSLIDVIGQAQGTAIQFIPDPKEGKDRQITEGADGYKYYVDDGTRVLPDVVKSNEMKQGEKYTTFLNLQSTGYKGTFEDYLKETEVIKPEKVPKYIWAKNKINGNDLRITDEDFDSSTMDRSYNRQGDGNKNIWAYNKSTNQMEWIKNEEYDPEIFTKNPPKMSPNDLFTNNYKDYLQTTQDPTPKGYLEYLDRNEKTQVTKEPTSYEEYSRTTEDPTPAGYLEYLEKFKLNEPTSYQEYLKTDDTPTTEEFGEFLDSKKKSGFTTDYKNYLKTLEDESEATGQGFASFLDEQNTTKQSDKDYWVWDKKEGDWILIKGSEFDSSRHSKEPLNQAIYLSGDGEFAELVESTMALKKQELEGKINPNTNAQYTNEEINEILRKDTLKLAEQRLEALASEQPNVLSPEDQLQIDKDKAAQGRRDKKIDEYFSMADAKGESAAGKLTQYQSLEIASEDAIAGPFLQPTREWAGGILEYLGWNKEEAINSMTPSMRTMVEALNGFVGGNIMSTDVVRALTNLGTLANAENGALPGNLNQAEFKTLKESYATLFNSKEGFDMIIQLYKRDTEIDQLRYEALDNFSFTGKLEGRLFGDESFEGLSDGEAVLKVKQAINGLRDDLISGNDEYGWSDLTEAFDSVKRKGKIVSDWNKATVNGQGIINVEANVDGKDVTFDVNLKDVEAGKKIMVDGKEREMKVEFIGYSNDESKITYQGTNGPQEVFVSAGPNKPVYAINTGTFKGNGLPNIVIKGFIQVE